jgi:hypothetical protein
MIVGRQETVTGAAVHRSHLRHLRAVFLPTKYTSAYADSEGGNNAGEMVLGTHAAIY